MKSLLSTLILLLPWCLVVASQELEEPRLQGTWQQGGLLLGRTDPGTEVFLNERAVPVSPEGHFVIGLGRSAPARATLTTVRGGERQQFEYSVAAREYDIQRIDGVPQETVTPPREVLDRIRREAEQVARARSVVDPRLDYLAGFRAPLEGPITGVYGSQRIYNGTPRSPHYGLDIAAPTGAPVTAPAAGVVRLVHPDMYYSGGTLIIDHGYGVSSSFIHLSEVLVEEGQRVARGDPIALVGASGRATGPHLDWRMNWLDVRVDPAIVLAQFPVAATP